MGLMNPQRRSRGLPAAASQFWPRQLRHQTAPQLAPRPRPSCLTSSRGSEAKVPRFTAIRRACPPDQTEVSMTFSKIKRLPCRGIVLKFGAACFLLHQRVHRPRQLRRRTAVRAPRSARQPRQLRLCPASSKLHQRGDRPRLRHRSLACSGPHHLVPHARCRARP